MTRKDFDDLVQRVEARYQGRPAGLERAAANWVRLGQAGAILWVGLGLGCGLAAFVGGIMLPPEFGVWLLGLGVALLVYATSQAALFLASSGEPEEGRVLRSGEMPALVALLDDLRGELACQPFGEIRLSMDFNASVRETSRRGLLGRPGSVLELGLPLMSALTPEEFRAVLAHEFAHLSARHGRGGRRVGRLYRTWDTLMGKLQGSPAGSSDRAVRWAVSRFVDWYWPRFRAHAVVLSRLQEFQADRVAAEVAGVETFASALWRIECVGFWLSERFWIDLHGLAAEDPEPPGDILTRLHAALEAPPPGVEAARWVERGLKRSTGVDDTHPAFQDRVHALGLSPQTVPSAGFRPSARPTAAEEYLGPEHALIADELSQTWARSQSGSWRERHRRSVAEARRRELEAKVSAAEPTVTVDVSALWESAREAVDLLGFDAALPALHAILELDPLHAGAAVYLGHHLVSRDDHAGERLLWEVVERGEQQWMHSACESLQNHYRSTGQSDRLRDVRAQLDRFDTESEQANREHATVAVTDDLQEHGLTDEQLGPLRSLLGSEPGCAAAWLGRKKLNHFPQRPLFLLCVRGVANRWGFANADLDRNLARRLIPHVELPGQVLVITRHGIHRRLARKLQSFTGTQIYAIKRPGSLESQVAH